MKLGRARDLTQLWMTAALALGCSGSQSSAGPGPLDAEPGPLVCDAAHPCLALDDALTAECAGTRRISRAACGPFTELVLETDPTSVVYTKERRFYDGTGKLVGLTMFVNEYGRNVSEGTVPTCPPAQAQPLCPRP